MGGGSRCQVVRTSEKPSDSEFQGVNKVSTRYQQGVKQLAETGTATDKSWGGGLGGFKVSGCPCPGKTDGFRISRCPQGVRRGRLKVSVARTSGYARLPCRSLGRGWSREQQAASIRSRLNEWEPVGAWTLLRPRRAHSGARRPGHCVMMRKNFALAVPGGTLKLNEPLPAVLVCSCVHKEYDVVMLVEEISTKG